MLATLPFGAALLAGEVSESVSTMPVSVASHAQTQAVTKPAVERGATEPQAGRAGVLCQDWGTPTGGWQVWYADQDLSPTIVADDFLSLTGVISTIQAWGSWIDSESDCNFGRCDCACEGDDVVDCTPIVTDKFEVCVYNDALLGGNNPSLPDTAAGPIDCSTATASRVLEAEGSGFDLYAFTLTLDVPLGVPIFVPLWLQITNNTDEPAGNTCNFAWSRALPGEGNDWSARDGDGIPDSNDGQTFDMAWCYPDGSLPSGPAPIGSCCICQPTPSCAPGTTKAQCNAFPGLWKIEDANCLSGTCPVTGPGNDDCASGLPIFGESGLPQSFSNVCATTDGPDTAQCEFAGPSDIGADIWYQYISACDGTVTISMCDDADYDGALAVYETPGGCFNPTVNCPPDPGNLVTCGDDTCGVGAGPPEVQFEATSGLCYLLQVAGWRDTRAEPDPNCVEGCQGVGSFTISCLQCVPPEALQVDPSCPPEGCEVGCGGKSRYASFSTDSTGSLGIRMTFDTVPGFGYAEGRQMWVQEPFRVTEASGSSGPGEPGMWAANLGCNPFYTDWSVYDVVDILDAGIIGEGVYELQAIAEGALTTAEECYSLPLTVETSRVGDATGTRTTPSPVSPPNCDCDFNDIGQVVDKFKNEPTAPRKARADLTNSNVDLPKPDHVVDFVDIGCAVGCFTGTLCTSVGPPVVNPCP
jgi:hypothetical protein